MKKKHKELFEKIFKTNIETIKKDGDLMPITFLIGKDDKMTAIATPFGNLEEKHIVRRLIKAIVLGKGIKAYIFCSDTKMTEFPRDKPANVANVKVYECMVTQLFTPKENYGKMAIHDGKKITKIKGFPKNNSSEWDVWKSKDLGDEKVEKLYEMFKKQNPDLYEDVK